MRRAASSAPRRSVRAQRRRPVRRGIQAAAPGSVAGCPARGGWATYSTVVAGLGAHWPRCKGSSALAAWSGGRCGVTWTDAHLRFASGDASGPTASATSRAVASRGTRRTSTGSAPSSLDGERQEPLQPIAERVELGLGPVVRAAADDGLARVEEQVQHRLAAPRARSRASAIMSSSDEYDGRSHRRRSDAELPQHALGRVRPRRARVERTAAAWAAAGSAPPSTGTSSRLLRARPAWRCRRPGSTGVSGASTKSGPPLCAS